MEKILESKYNPLKISVCIPQYNRIDFLKIALKEIEVQTYNNIEICIADDASTDNTKEEIEELKKKYKFPISYHRFETNQGYDRNLRKSMELASGDYCFILGNDDSLSDNGAIARLATFIQANNYPDVGFCNSSDYVHTDDVQIRAKTTQVIGSGANVALKYYSSFSFVAGLIFKKQAFNQYNTDAYDRSIYVQIYLATAIIANGGKLFTFAEPLVRKDIRVNDQIANSYRDTLPRKWKDFRPLDAGLPSYSKVAFIGITAQNPIGKHQIAYKILKRIYLFTYPFWLIDYRHNKAFVASIGLAKGLTPPKFAFYKTLRFTDMAKIHTIYLLGSFAGLLMPVWMFNRLKKSFYSIAKK